ncbi:MULTISPECIES: DNA translocase FtsK [Methylocaldum]|jgi:S-DNA-T family DNA segregation ATPase FtsK/SpoIIIE|uniref:DNA translocase FtsK n=1 Tax=Methylocaldum sp. GT1BB TaxID=3438963 RepID=UPI000A320C14
MTPILNNTPVIYLFDLVRILSQFYKKLTIGQDLGSVLVRGLREAAFLIYLAISLFFLISLMTFDSSDPGWSHTGTGHPIANGGGAVGAWLADFSLSLFGIPAFLFPFLLSGYGYAIYKGPASKEPSGAANYLFRWFGFGTAMAAGSALADIHVLRLPFPLPVTSGGILGQEAAGLLTGAFGTTGATILLISFFLAGVSLYTSLSWLGLLDAVGKGGLMVANGFFAAFRALAGTFRPERQREESEPRIDAPRDKVKPKRIEPTVKRKPQPPEVKDTKEPKEPREPFRFRKAAKPVSTPLPNEGELPPLDLLNNVAPKVRGYSDAALEEMSQLVETILADFGVEVQVTEVHPGPVITRFEIQPAAGVKVSRISGLAKDLARALSVTSVRVVEIIPGKSVIGLEIPNEERETVLLHSVLSSEPYQHSGSPLTLVLGKDISGQPVVANLARMPHLLVAGTTGSGKSVAVNVMILSMLFKARPDEIRLIMIDPKMLELSVYEGIPHLLTPVVTDMKEAANALRWCVAEMERRYKLMSMLGVRNLAGFNQKVTEAIESGQPIRDPMWSADQALEGEEPPTLTPLPYVVIVIDELADMMMIVGKKVEELIARLAQKARAAGLHLILATQRPSVDVLTGLIKANIPTRIAFQVSSRIDSRTIIDQGGAEALLGNGDMLYLPPGTGLPMRAHGAFVSDQEVHNVVEFLKRTGRANYIDEITRFSEDGGDFSGAKSPGGGDGEELDALYDEAVRFVTESRKASISSVQRRFKVGYNRAARMIEDMEKAGVVGPAETNGSREVLAPPPPDV